MLDESTQERLLALTPDQVAQAVKELAVHLESVRQDGIARSIARYPWHAVLSLVFQNIPETLDGTGPPMPVLSADVEAFLKERHLTLYRCLGERYGVGEIGKARKLVAAIDKLRDMADEAKHAHDWIPRDVPNAVAEALCGLMREGRSVPSPITKQVRIKDFVHLLLKDVRQLHPGVHEEYLVLRSRGRADTPLGRAVQRTISHRYFSGVSQSFCPLYVNDILRSPQFQAMSAHPKHQLVLLDMIDRVNFLSATRGDDSIETTGFWYTWSDCRVEVSQSVFRQAIKEIVERGWFKVAGKRRTDHGPPAKLYIPATDWKTKPLTQDEIDRIQEVHVAKTREIAASRERYRKSATLAPTELGSVEHIC